MDSKNFDNLSIGYMIPELTIAPTHMQLFMYSAATWNRHHVHYSKDAAIEEGLPDVVVHRGLMGNFITQMLDKWLNNHGEIVSVNWKVVSSATPGTELACTGMVTNLATEMGTQVELDVFINDQKRIIALGNAIVRINQAT